MADVSNTDIGVTFGTTYTDVAVIVKNTNNDNKMATVSRGHSFRQKRKARLGCDAVEQADRREP